MSHLKNAAYFVESNRLHCELKEINGVFKVVQIYDCHTALEERWLASLFRCILLDSSSLGLFETIWVNIGFVAM